MNKAKKVSKKIEKILLSCLGETVDSPVDYHEFISDFGKGAKKHETKVKIGDAAYLITGFALTKEIPGKKKPVTGVTVKFFGKDPKTDKWTLDRIEVGSDVALKILSTSLDMLKKMIKKYDPHYVVIKAHSKDEARVGVYKKLITRFVSGEGKKFIPLSTRLQDIKTKDGQVVEHTVFVLSKVGNDPILDRTLATLNQMFPK